MKKNFVLNSVPIRPGQENSKKNSKKIQCIKRIILAIFLLKTGWHRPRKRKKKFVPNSVLPDPGKEIPKKIKTSFRNYFYPKRAEIGREREKKIFIPNSVPSRLGLENSQRTRKKILKKKIILTIFQCKLGWDRPTKREKKFRPEFRYYPTRVRKFPKK